MRRHKIAVGFALAVALSTRSAADDFALHIIAPSKLETAKGTKLELPPGYFLDEPTWKRLDDELKRLQEAETRLRAENESFRKSAQEWQPGWKTLLGATLSGIAIGAYAYSKL